MVVDGFLSLKIHWIGTQPHTPGGGGTQYWWWGSFWTQMIRHTNKTLALRCEGGRGAQKCLEILTSPNGDWSVCLKRAREPALNHPRGLPWHNAQVQSFAAERHQVQGPVEQVEAGGEVAPCRCLPNREMVLGQRGRMTFKICAQILDLSANPEICVQI